jgi:hypothetical protein
MLLNETERAVCRMTGVTEEQFAHAKAKRGALPNDAADGEDGDSALAQCYKKASLEHLQAARGMIGREIDRRTAGASRVHFVR